MTTGKSKVFHNCIQEGLYNNQTETAAEVIKP